MQSRWHGLGVGDLAWARRAKEFVDTHVVPATRDARDDEWSAPWEARVPWDLIEEADDYGLRTLGLFAAVPDPPPPSSLGLAAVAEELARGESALVDILLQGWKVGTIIEGLAAGHLRDHWLGRFLAEPRLVFSHCSTEPHGSSDRWLGWDHPDAAMRTTAELRDGEWILDGRKHYITNGPDSGLYVVYATTSQGARPSAGTSSFLVPRDTPGFSIGRVHEKLGGRRFNNAELIFDGCRLPADHLLVADTALGTSSRLFPASKAVIAAQALGVAQAAYEAALDYVQQRVQGGRPIVGHQAVALRVADMLIRIETTRALVHRAARAVDEEAPDRRRLRDIAKVAAAETAFAVAREAVELHGGLGVMREGGVERHLRDATLFLHLDGTNDIHRLRVVESLFPGWTERYVGDPG
ncbi:MAG TPA: acyl-CoA dehydrogenase family protein [Egicoccus sp.]|nr:acyl-CoA dehydrogenase family protein [Egicoccus sp.]HSK22020.1 acyl-CoA dehydrogenase family protein [Egicoccus sp.]